ncbi:GNAT family N-acetyltransferase [Pseudooceanicola aestuarii]|uniref:GNAT family N-acetyltransferase n=1 Tax=Pseudooceanicola aestuarii TaxID=2697319 RepID=UPI0013D6BE5C|nr:GNAT family N-acetyltransferase [Pseudooceanicola aestuarii]
MDATDPPTLLGTADVPACMALSEEACWNQRAADWRMMLTLGTGLALRDGGGIPRATALALPLGEAMGWISMVLVTQALRGHGHAKRLMLAAIATLEDTGRIPVLDATPAGEPLYRRLGFREIGALSRMAGTGLALHRAAAPRGAGIRPLRGSDLAWMIPLDRQVLGAERGPVLHDLMTRPGALALCRLAHDGFVLSRAGRDATQIGPLVAPDIASACALLESALSRVSGPVLIDVTRDGPLEGWLTERGFCRQRPFLRMARGGTGPIGDPARYFAAAGPELG